MPENQEPENRRINMGDGNYNKSIGNYVQGNVFQERMFLLRVGGRYRFIHKLLQDHFAQMDFERLTDN